MTWTLSIAQGEIVQYGKSLFVLILDLTVTVSQRNADRSVETVSEYMENKNF